MFHALDMRVEDRIAFISRHIMRTPSRRVLSLPPASAGSCVRIHRGWYITSAQWAALSREDKHLAVMLAADRSATSPLVFTLVSAAVLLGLPIYGDPGLVVHTAVGANGNGSPGPRLRRHKISLDPSEIVEVAGLQCTTADRTIFDLSCTSHSELALACADGHLRSEFRVNRSIDSARLGEWKEDMDRRLFDARSRRGVRTARQVLALTTPKTDSALESVSHLQLRRLGFEVELQVAVPGPQGQLYFVDFELVGLGLFGECDGKSKYTDPELRGGSTAEEIVYREKRRQEWLCGTTGKGMVRWGHPDVLTAVHLGRRLQAFGVPMPRRPW